MEHEAKGHSIELLLSQDSTERLREKLCEVESGPWHEDPFRPHLSLAVIREPVENVDQLRAFVQSWAARQVPIVVKIASIGVFPGKRPVLTLMPAWNRELLSVHHQVDGELKKLEISPIGYYQREQWSPHVTLMMGRPRREVSLAIEGLSRVRWPGEYLLDEVELVEFHPATRLEKLKLGGA